MSLFFVHILIKAKLLRIPLTPPRVSSPEEEIQAILSVSLADEISSIHSGFALFFFVDPADIADLDDLVVWPIKEPYTSQT